jgi:hypothetical protein
MADNKTINNEPIGNKEVLVSESPSGFVYVGEKDEVIRAQYQNISQKSSPLSEPTTPIPEKRKDPFLEISVNKSDQVDKAVQRPIAVKATKRTEIQLEDGFTLVTHRKKRRKS